MKFKKYRTKPIIVEAYQWLKYNQDDEVGHYTDWQLSFGKCKYCGKSWKRHGWISTLQGGHMVCPSDWIIHDIVDGEFYPCKPGIFKKTYEEVK